MHLLKTMATVLLMGAFLPVLAQDDVVVDKEFKGKLIKKNNSTYFSYKKGSRSEQVRVHATHNIFCGHDVWIFGNIEPNTRYMHANELVTAKNSVIEGRTGQGVVLVGSLRPNSFNGLNFVPENEKAIEQMGGIQSLHVVWPDQHYLKGSKEYIHKAFIKGVVVGNSLYVSSEAYSFHVISQKAKIEAGDHVVVSGILFDRDSIGDDSDYRSHFSGSYGLTYGNGSNDSYGLNVFEGQYLVEDTSTVLVKDKKTGEFIPAEFERSEIRASPADELVGDLMQDQTLLIMTGEMTSDNHLLVHDAKLYSESTGIPTVAQTQLAQLDDEEMPAPSKRPKATESLEGKKYGHLKVVADNKRPTSCGEALSSEKSRPKLTIVPKD